MNYRSISLDEAKFKNASKKILSELKGQNFENLKLQNVQEMLAKSLGFRNLSSLQSIYNPAENTFYSPNRYHILLTLNLDACSHLISALLSPSPYHQQALYLFSSIMPSLSYLEREKILLLDFEILIQFIHLTEIIKLYKDYRYIPSRLKHPILEFFYTLTDFNFDCVFHDDNFSGLEKISAEYTNVSSLLQMACKKLIALENNNFVVASPLWFDLEQEYLLKPSLMHIDFIEHSWIMMPAFQDWIRRLYRNKKMKILTLSDFIYYTTNLILEKERKQLMNVIKSISSNVMMASKLSDTIEKTYINIVKFNK